MTFRFIFMSYSWWPIFIFMEIHEGREKIHMSCMNHELPWAVWIVMRESGRFFETLELFKITKVYECHDQKSEQNMLKKCVFLEKTRPSWSKFISKTMIFFVIRGNLLLFRDLEWSNFINFDAFAAKCSFVKVNLV